MTTTTTAGPAASVTDAALESAMTEGRRQLAGVLAQYETGAREGIADALAGKPLSIDRMTERTWCALGYVIAYDEALAAQRAAGQ